MSTTISTMSMGEKVVLILRAVSEPLTQEDFLSLLTTEEMKPEQVERIKKELVEALDAGTKYGYVQLLNEGYYVPISHVADVLALLDSCPSTSSAVLAAESQQGPCEDTKCSCRVKEQEKTSKSAPRSASNSASKSAPKAASKSAPQE